MFLLTKSYFNGGNSIGLIGSHITEGIDSVNE